MKNFDEIAKIIFKRRDEYVAKQKKKNRIVVSTAVSIICAVVLLTAFGLAENVFVDNRIPVAEDTSGQSKESGSQTSKNSRQNSTTKGTAYQQNAPSSAPSQNHKNDSQGKVSSDEKTASSPSVDTPKTSFGRTPSTANPDLKPPAESGYFIDSIDKINFYSAKKIINETSFFPRGMSYKSNGTPAITPLSNIYVQYPIDRKKVFTTTMVTYFTVELHNEKGFLAQKLGGTGLVEVVVTKNNIDDMGEMITFKRGENFYTCFTNGGEYDYDANASSREFSSHKYIDGYNLVKNMEQENYKFTVHYESSKVVGFECAPFGGGSTAEHVDDVTFIDDFCVVIYTNKTFTIDQLEAIFNGGTKATFSLV